MKNPRRVAAPFLRPSARLCATVWHDDLARTDDDTRPPERERVADHSSGADVPPDAAVSDGAAKPSSMCARIRPMRCDGAPAAPAHSPSGTGCLSVR